MKLKREMKAYIVLLHLCSQKWMNLGDMIKLFGWDGFHMGDAQHTVAHINNRLKALRDEWGEDIPIMNAFAFDRYGNCTSYICETVFGTEEQPSPQNVVKYAHAIASYDKWDKVLEVFREEAFQD